MGRDQEPSAAFGNDLILRRVFAVIKRQWKPLAICLTLALVMATTFLLTAARRYTATAELVIENRDVQLAQQQPVLNEVNMDSAAVDSQIRVIESTTIADAVVNRFRLAQDPELTDRGSLSRFINFISGTSDSEPSDAELAWLAGFNVAQNRTVTRVGRSNAVRISYRSSDPGKAVGIANAIAQAYIADRLAAKHNMAKQAADWMLQRAEELQQSAMQADRDALEFRNRNSTTTREGQVELSALESKAHAYRTLHDSFLRRYLEATQQESLPSTDARLISPAAVAFQTYPNTLITLFLAVFLGSSLGGGLALLREIRIRVFRTGDDVARELGVPLLATFKQRGLDGTLLPAQILTIESFFLKVEECCGARMPFVIGLTSTLASEGAPQLAMSTARFMAQTGHPALLIDAGGGFDEAGLPYSSSGSLSAAIDGRVTLKDAIYREPDTGLCVVSLCDRGRSSDLTKVLSSAQFLELMRDLRGSYFYVVMSFPPLTNSTAARAGAQYVDVFALAIATESTSREVVRDALQDAAPVADKLLGAALTPPFEKRARLWRSRPATPIKTAETRAA